FETGYPRQLGAGEEKALLASHLTLSRLLRRAALSGPNHQRGASLSMASRSTLASVATATSSLRSDASIRRIFSSSAAATASRSNWGIDGPKCSRPSKGHASLRSPFTSTMYAFASSKAALHDFEVWPGRVTVLAGWVKGFPCFLLRGPYEGQDLRDQPRVARPYPGRP